VKPTTANLLAASCASSGAPVLPAIDAVLTMTPGCAFARQRRTAARLVTNAPSANGCF
jgi:hypothetical protein